MNHSEDDMKLAEELGNLFGGNGLTHQEQLVLVAERLAEWRFHAFMEGRQSSDDDLMAQANKQPTSTS